MRMVIEESVHYSIVAHESPQEWLSFTAFIGDGAVRLGPAHRLFAVSMIHQLHCLRSIRDSMAQSWTDMDNNSRNHAHHCLNYLRDRMLCQADTTLEPGDFAIQNFSRRRSGATHTCTDWKPAFDYVWDNWLEWNAFQQEHGIA